MTIQSNEITILEVTQAKFGNGFGISSDKIGEIYIADFENQVIRKVNTSGVISTVAGNGIAGNFGDGGLAINAQLNYPNWVAVDNIGNIFISDMNNNKIRKVNTSGIISTFAGAASGSSGYSGDGGLATYALLSLPQGIAIDSIGNVYISDSGNDRIRLIDTSGIISTYAGNGTPGYSGDGGLATYANIGGRSGICVDNKRNLYLADAFTNRIRKVTFENTSVEQTESDNHLINVYPNPTSNELTIDFALTEKSYFELYDIFGAKRKEVTLVSSKQSEKINLSDIDSGLYFYSVFDRKENNIKTGKLIIIK
jgi:sugar lactone lactonase YvrE